ncbi:MAG: type IIL restriction-modification enzyme MmeI [Pseudonocardia sp.]
MDELHRFLLQAVWCFFAEDLGMLDGYPIQTIVDVLRRDQTRSSYAELGALFDVLNQKGNHNRQGVLAGTRYVNGDLFARPAKLYLEVDELDLMAVAAAFDWRKVNPTIFGSLLEGVVLGERRRELGAHYTHEIDILKIVEPTITRPWAKRIAATRTPAEARSYSTSCVASGCWTRLADVATSYTWPIGSCGALSTT